MVKRVETNSKISIKNLLNHIGNNIGLYLLCFICICTGIILGFYNVKYMSSVDKSSIIKWMESSLQVLKQENVSKNTILLGSISNYLPIVFLIWFLGLTIVGIPLILILDVLKGYALGFSFAFMTNNFGAKGIWIGAGSVLLQNLILIPCFIILSVYSMKFSIDILKNRLHNNTFGGVLTSVLSYSVKYILVFLVMFLGFLIEAYISPNVLNYLSSVFSGI